MTEEQRAAHVAALEREKAGYAARLKALKDGKPDRLDGDALADRIRQVDAELAKAKRRGRGKKADDAEPADSAGGDADGEG